MRKGFIWLATLVVLGVIWLQIDTLPDGDYQWLSQTPIPILGLQDWQWISMAAILVESILAGLLMRSILTQLTVFRDKFARTKVADGTRKSIRRSAAYFTGAVTASILIPDLGITGRHRYWERDIRVAIGVLAVVAGLILLHAWWDVACDSLTARSEGNHRAERILVPVMRKVVRGLIILAGVLVAIAMFFGPQTLGGIVAGLGLTSVVVALAAKDSVENVFGSITILFDMPFGIGDWIKIEKVEGAVEEINLRSTRIRTTEDTLISLPNANLIRASVENFGARRHRRQKVMLRVGYKTSSGNLEKFCQALRCYLTALPDSVPDKALVELDDPQENSVGIVAIWYLQTNEYAVEARSRHSFIEEALRLREEFEVILLPA